ncbi:MAG: glycosyltransferase family 2 protein [Anaerolineae bacterium]|nr:glycosyltransferase family 2 protein [Anaerolineae bacterium]
MPAVALNIVTYNSADTILTCFASVKAQRFTDFTVQVLDNASTDDTAALIEASDIPFQRSDRNLGYAAAHNRLIEATDSRYVLTLNPDVWLAPDFLGTMVEALDSEANIGSAAGLLLRVERLGDTPAHIDSTGLYMRPNRRQGLCSEGQPIAQAPSQPRPIFGPDGAAAFYRRAMLDDIRVQGAVFDSDFFMHKEDIDVCWRAQLRGWSSLYEPRAVAHHVRSFRPDRRERVSGLMRFYAVRNRYLLMIKNELPALLWRDLLPIALYEAGIFAYLLLRERASLRAYAAAWALRTHMLAKRREIHGRLNVGAEQMRRWFSGNCE